MNHSFDVEIARQYGVNVAIFLNNIAHWIQFNMASKKHFYDGRYWTYNTQEAFVELFNYWTRQNLRTILMECIDKKLIIKGNFNKLNYDRTTWYALTDLGLSLFKCFKSKQEEDKTLGWNQPMEGLDSTNPLVGINQPIPNINTDINTDKSTKPFYNDKKINKTPYPNTSGFACVTKQSNSAGAKPRETPQESQRIWEMQMRERGIAV